jgi:uncharacterized protein (TIGR02246 family)
MAQSTDTPRARAIQAADRAWAEAAAAKDLQRMLSFYDDEATFIAISGAVITGKARLRELWERMFTTPGYKLNWQATKVEVSATGDLACSYGSWQQTQLKDGQPVTTNGTYLAVWKRQTDGSWKVLIDKP